MNGFRLAAIWLALGAAAASGDDEKKGESALDVFNRRILPIFKSPKASSCTECHLGGVDLKDYISPDQAQTFASLRKEGLVDLENPDASKILKLIRMKPEKPNPIAEEARAKEYEAFRAWILEAVKDPGLAKAEANGKAVGPSVSDAVIRHSRKDRLLASFVENVWAYRGGCMGCHMPGEPPNPKAAENKRNWVAKHGEPAMFWLGSSGPEEALETLLKGKLLDLAQPSKSLLIAKPTQQVKHEGGQKMILGSGPYRAFLRFIEDYAKIKGGKYRRDEDLPGVVVTNQYLRVRNVPPQRSLMQIDLHRIVGGRPSAAAFASVVGGCGPAAGGRVEIALERSSKEFAEASASRKLPRGRYQLRFYIDSRNRLQANPLHKFGPQDLSGVLEIEADDWPEEPAPDGKKPLEIAAKVVEFPARRR